MADTITFNSAQDVDQCFRESRIFFNQTIVEKLPQLSIYYGATNTESWPENSLPTQQGFRMPRNFYDTDAPWHPVESGRCLQNSCDKEFEVIQHAGTNTYQFSLFNRRMKTDWYCLADIAKYRLFPLEEMNHIIKGNAIITASVHDEFTRTNWVASSQFKWVPLADQNSLVTCEEPEEDGFRLLDANGGTTGQPSMKYVYVKLPVASLGNIALSSLDILDELLIRLQGNDDAYRLDISEYSGQDLLQIILPDPRVGRSLWRQAKATQGNWDSTAGFDDKQMQYSMGIRRIIGDYAFCYDITAPHFNVDTTYNEGLPAFDETDIATWPRLIRVPALLRTESDICCQWVENPAYYRADFAFVIPWVQKAMTKWVQTGNISVGEATGMTQNYAGDWIWENPPWPDNLARDQGFFWNQFIMSMQILDPSLMNTILVRLNKSLQLNPACCDLNVGYTSPDQVDCFCVEE